MTITTKMKYCLTGASLLLYFRLVVTELATVQVGLIGNLKLALTPMYRLYLTMKERSSNQITNEEILVALGQKVLDPGAVPEFIGRAESANQDIRHAFKKQVQVAAVSEQLSGTHYFMGSETRRRHGVEGD